MAKDRNVHDDFAMSVAKNQSVYVRRISAADLRGVKPTKGKPAKVARRDKDRIKTPAPAVVD